MTVKEKQKRDAIARLRKRVGQKGGKAGRGASKRRAREHYQAIARIGGVTRFNNWLKKNGMTQGEFLKKSASQTGSSTPASSGLPRHESPQRAWQKRQRLLGNCGICGADAGGKFYCAKHRKMRHDKYKEKVGK